MRKKTHHEATEAIEFLSMVHEAFRNEQEVYNKFIALMREVRGGAQIPNHMLIERVQKLFRGRPELVNGFLRFFDNTPAETTQTDVRERPNEEREFLTRFMGESRMICIPPECTGGQFKSLCIGSLHLLPQDFQVLYKGQPYSDKTVLNFEDKAEVEVKEKQTYMVDFARDVLDTTKSSFENSQCFNLYVEFLKRLCQFAESTRNAEDLQEINNVVKSLFAQAGILNTMMKELLDYLPSLIYAHPHIRLYELQRDFDDSSREPSASRRRVKTAERKTKSRQAQKKRKIRSDHSYRRKRKRKDITLPTVPKLKTGPECVQEMFPNGLPFPKSALTSHGMKEFQTYMIFYWYGVLKLEEILKLCETTFGTSIDAYKKLELFLETTRGHDENSKFKEYYSIILSDDKSKSLPLVDNQISYRTLPDEIPLPSGANRTELEKQVLNDKYLSRAANYNDKSDQNVTKTKNLRSSLSFLLNDTGNELSYVLEESQSERLMRKARSNENEDRVLQVDEERYFADTHISSADGVLKSLRRTKEHVRANPEEKFIVSDWLNQQDFLFISELYGERIPMIMHCIEKNPMSVIPILERRVEAKKEEWVQYRQCTESHWHTTVEGNHYCSLDVVGSEFRSLLKHAMRPKHLWEELRKDGNSLDDLINRTMIDQYSKVRSFTETTYIVATLSNCVVNEPGLLGWKVDATSEDWQHFASLFRAASGSSTYDSFQLDRFVRDVLKEIFDVETKKQSEFETMNVEHEHKFNWERHLYDIVQSQKAKDKSLLALFPKTTEITIVELMTLPYRQDCPCLMFATEPLYCLLRHIMLFHARLGELRWIMEKTKDAQPNRKAVYEVTTLMNTLGDALRDSAEVGIFEEEIQLAFGPQAFRITSLYKLMQDIVKMAQNVSSDIITKKLLILAKAHKERLRSCRLKSDFEDWMALYQTLSWEASKKPGDNFVCIQNDGEYLSMELIEVDFAEEVYEDITNMGTHHPIHPPLAPLV